MPYEVNADLPPSVRTICPSTRRRFSARPSTTPTPPTPTTRARREAAFRIAWAAVKRVYEKVGDEWVEKG